MQFRPVLQIVRILNESPTSHQRGFQTTFEQTIGRFEMILCGEIRFQESNRQIGDGRSLVTVRRGSRIFRIDNRESWNDNPILQSTLIVTLLKNRAIGHLRAAAGNRRNDANGNTIDRLGADFEV